MARLSALLLLLSTLPAGAEERTYAITIDGQPAGEMTVSFQARDNGSTAVTVHADYHADRPVPLALEYRGTETWKDGRLVRLEGLGSENRQKGGITLVAGKGAYALKAGVKEVSIRDDVWPTTAVMLPDPDRRLLVVDALTGDVLRAKVEKVGAERITVAGKPVTATRYRVTAGGNRWDVWYDADPRLVKRMWTRDGRTVVAELKACTAD
jgi:hypothetical protein